MSNLTLWQEGGAWVLWKRERIVRVCENQERKPNEESGAAPPALDRLAMDPALPGWADFWCRPSGPGLQTPLSHVHSSLNLPKRGHRLPMTKGRAGFQLRSVAGIPGLKSETWGTLRLLTRRLIGGQGRPLRLGGLERRTADPSASLRDDKGKGDGYRGWF